MISITRDWLNSKAFTLSVELKKSFFFQKVKQPIMAPKCHSSHHFLNNSQHFLETVPATLFNCSTILFNFFKTVPTIFLYSSHYCFKHFSKLILKTVPTIFFEQFAPLFKSSSHHCFKHFHILFLESFHNYIFSRQFLVFETILVFSWQFSFFKMVLVFIKQF